MAKGRSSLIDPAGVAFGPRRVDLSEKEGEMKTRTFLTYSEAWAFARRYADAEIIASECGWVVLFT
jgi:hypothetical protein